MLILVCCKDYQQVVYYLQFIYTYMTMTTTKKKIVNQFSRITNSSYDDTLPATRKCIHDDFYNVRNNSATLPLWSRLKTSCTKLSTHTE